MRLLAYVAMYLIAPFCSCHMCIHSCGVLVYQNVHVTLFDAQIRLIALISLDNFARDSSVLGLKLVQEWNLGGVLKLA